MTTTYVKRNILGSSAFSEVLRKLMGQQMKLVHSHALFKFAKDYDEQVKLMGSVYNKCKEACDKPEENLEWREYFTGDAEIMALPKSLLEESNLELSAQELFFLDAVLAK